MGGVCFHSTPHGSAAQLYFSLQESTNVLCPGTEKAPKPDRNSALSKETTRSLGRVSQSHLIPYLPGRTTSTCPPGGIHLLSPFKPSKQQQLLSDLPVLPRALRKISYCPTWILVHDFLPLLFVPLERNRKGVFTYNCGITFYTLQDSYSSSGSHQPFLLTMCHLLCTLWSVSTEKCPKVGKVLEWRSHQC